MSPSFSFVTLIAVLTISAAQAQTCKTSIPRTAPDSRYQLVVGSGGSEVLDPQTNLIWQRCSVGQIWNGTTCIGTATTHTWQNALQQAKNYGSAWRLPNIKELQSLVEEACFLPAINATFFPATPSRMYWSASLYVNSDNLAWSMNFDLSDVYSSSFKYGNFHVRAVRAGQ